MADIHELIVAELQSMDRTYVASFPRAAQRHAKVNVLHAIRDEVAVGDPMLPVEEQHREATGAVRLRMGLTGG